MTPDLPRTLFVGRSSSAVCWYRCALPAMALGVDWVGVCIGPPDVQANTGSVPLTRGLEQLAEYEVVVLQLPATPAWHDAIRRLQSAGVRVLFEIDDYVHGIRKMVDHELRGNFGKEELAHYETSMRLADGLIVSTEYLARRYRAFNRDVSVCRNGLDLPRYDLTLPVRDGATIGWAGGTGHRDALKPWMPSVAAVLRERPATRFATIGQPWAHVLEAEFGDRALAVPFSPLGSYPAAMTNLDVALAPAGANGFFRGKSDLRWLEASALGIPVIADPLVYPEVEHGVTGFHAANPGEVGELLLALVDDPGLRRRVGEAARAHVREHRSIQAMAGQWAEVLTAAARPEAQAA